MQRQTPIKQNRSRASARWGYSLVEVMMVVSILAVAAGLVIPAMSQTDTSRVAAAANLVAADIGSARVESLSHGEALRSLIFQRSQQRYYIARTKAPNSPLTHERTGQSRATIFGTGRAAQLQGVTIQSVGTTSDRLDFGLYGELVNATGNVELVLACGEQQITLTIEASTGEVTISQPRPISS